jgi:hypothetical protein
MKKLIAITALTGLIAVGCAHRDKDNDNNMNSSNRGASYDTSSGNASGSVGASGSYQGNSSTKWNSGSSSSSTGSQGGTSNNSDTSKTSGSSSSSQQ